MKYHFQFQYLIHCKYITLENTENESEPEGLSSNPTVSARKTSSVREYGKAKKQVDPSTETHTWLCLLGPRAMSKDIIKQCSMELRFQ